MEAKNMMKMYYFFSSLKEKEINLKNKIESKSDQTPPLKACFRR